MNQQKPHKSRRTIYKISMIPSTSECLKLNKKNLDWPKKKKNPKIHKKEKAGQEYWKTTLVGGIGYHLPFSTQWTCPSAIYSRAD